MEEETEVVNAFNSSLARSQTVNSQDVQVPRWSPLGRVQIFNETDLMCPGFTA